MRDLERIAQDARAMLREAADAATSARRVVRHVLEGLESIIALRASAGSAQDIHRVRELVDDLRAARRSAGISLCVAQRSADDALHALGGESPGDRARTRARNRAELKGRHNPHHRRIGRASRARTPRPSGLKRGRHGDAARVRRPPRARDAAPA